MLIILWHRNYLAKDSRDIRLFVKLSKCLVLQSYCSATSQICRTRSPRTHRSSPKFVRVAQKQKCYKAFVITLLQLFSRSEDGGSPVIPPYANHLSEGKTNTAHEGLKNYASIYWHSQLAARVRDAHKSIKRQSLRFA